MLTPSFVLLPLSFVVSFPQTEGTVDWHILTFDCQLAAVLVCVQLLEHCLL